jgi:hypothetical protein
MGAKWKAASLGRFRPLFTRVLGRCCLRPSPVRDSPKFSCFVVGHENAPSREKACGSNSSVLMLAAPLSSPLNQVLSGYRALGTAGGP